VARPLREQFAIASFLLLAPVAIVMTIAATLAFRSQVDQVNGEASFFAKVIANYIDRTDEPPEQGLRHFLDGLPAPAGTLVSLIDDKTNQTFWTYRYSSEAQGQPMPESVRPKTRKWTVSVSFPSGLAWQRAVPVYRTTIAISGLATAILIVMQVFFLRRLLPALRALERHAAEVGAGDLNARFDNDRMPSLELEHVRNAFHDMVDSLRGARETVDRQMEEERQMRTALQSLQQQVIRQERLAAIGVLVSGIAHELNNPLQTIAGISDLLQRDLSLSADRKADLALVFQESERASAIIRNLSRFGRQTESKPVAVNLAEVLASVIELRQRRLIEQGIRLDRDEKATRPAFAVFTELQQVVLNFVINAEHAVRSADAGKRRIVIRTRDVDSGVCLEVEDTGQGVMLENEAKLFQPFFTTKPVGEGTGLGLSVSYGIIQSLGGEIGYRRGEFGGALFYFTVPVVRQSA
jgi:C4-dicarboxylate-specific signal transduction histidine kinase